MTQDVRAKLTKEYAARRQMAQVKAAQKRDAIYAACPALSEIDGQMADASREAALARIAGDIEAATRKEAEIRHLGERKVHLLATVGATEEDMLPQYTCARCEDTGKIDTSYCSCFVNRMLEENMRAASLVKQAGEQTFDRFDLSLYSDQIDPRFGISIRKHMEKVLQKCRGFAEGFAAGDNLLMLGAPGLGKTFLSSAIANRLLERGKTVAYVSAAEFFANYSQNHFTDHPMSMEMYYDCDLLILDDLGTEFKTGLTVSLLGEIIDRRLREGKNTILSTNLSFSELEAAYHERVVSRLLGNYTYLLFAGEDIRVKLGGK